MPSSSSNDSASSYLCATRSFTDFTLLHLSTSTTKINHKFNYPFRELSNYPISDFILGGIKFNDFGNQGFNRLGSGMMIDLVGNLYGWGLDRNISSNGNNNGNNKKGGLSSKGSKPEMFKLRKGNRDCSSGDGSGFARVIFGGSRGVDAVVGFRDTVLLYDLRVSLSFCFLALDFFFLFEISNSYFSSNLLNGLDGKSFYNIIRYRITFQINTNR